MDPEERERRVRHRVDEPADEMTPLGPKHEVVAPERHDPRLHRGVRQCGEPVGVDASTDDDACGLDRPGTRLHERDPATPGETDDLAPEQELTARGPNVVGVRLRHASEVDHRGLGRVQRADTGDVRLQLAQPLGADQLDTRDAVRERPAMELLETGELGGVGRDDDLPAAQDRDPALVAVREQGRRALDAELRLERTGGVVDAAMDDTTGMARLVRAGRDLLVEDGDAGLRAPC